jgi:arylsulfatase A-like enzyme
LFWHFPHYHGSGNIPSGAVRSGDYKLIEWFEDGSIELYNLKDDISEKHDLAASKPEKADELL